MIRGGKERGGLGINLSQESNRVTVGVRGLPENTSDLALHCGASRDTRAYVDARGGGALQQRKRGAGRGRVSPVGEGFIGGLALVYIVSNGFA